MLSEKRRTYAFIVVIIVAAIVAVLVGYTAAQYSVERYRESRAVSSASEVDPSMEPAVELSEKGATSTDSSSLSELPDIELVPHAVLLDGERKEGLRVAEGLELSVAAEGLGKARFMTKSPDGRLFVPDMVDYNLSREGRLLILDDFDPETGAFASQHTYLSGLRGPHNVAFYTDEQGQTWLYLTLTKHLVRYPYQEGDTAPSGAPEVVMEFPNKQSEGAEGVVWHITRTVLFQGDTMFVSIGSGCNICEEAEDEFRAMILTARPDGSDVEVYAEGIKNAVGMTWVDGMLYATDNGSDHLGDDAPNDLLFRVERGEHYGWPYCYELNGVKLNDNSQNWERKNVQCDEVPLAFAAFDPHSAPLGVTYVPSQYRGQSTLRVVANTFLVALQGSWEPEIGTGYQVMRVSRDGAKDVLIDGFQKENGERIGRPVHVLQWGSDAFLISDDFNGRIYYLSQD